MKKKLVISLIAAAIITGSAFADMATVSGLTTTKKDCDNGSEGFTVEIKRSGISQYVAYDSCSQEGMSVVASAAEAGGEETVYISYLDKDVYFVNGYTTPSGTPAPDNTCENGFNPSTQYIYCEERNDLTALNDGWLELVEAGTISLASNPLLDNIDNLANLTSVSHLFLVSNAALSDFSGLSNLTSADRIDLVANPLMTNLDHLSNLTSIYQLNIRDNAALSDFSGLSNLTSAGRVDITNNPLLTDLDVLSNLTGGSYYMDFRFNDNLTDISGLNNVTYLDIDSLETQVIFDLKDYDVKLAADSYLCNEGLSYVDIWDGEIYRNPSTSGDKSMICD